MRKPAFIIILLFIFTATGVSFAKMLKSEKVEEQAIVAQVPKKERNKAEEELNEIDIKVGLYPEQKDKILGLISAAQDQKRKILEDAGTRISAVDVKMEADIEKVLTEEQRTKFRATDVIQEESAKEKEDEWLKVFR